MTIKEQITQELEKLPEPLLQEILDFVQFLQAKHQQIAETKQIQEHIESETHTQIKSTGSSLLEHLKTISTPSDSSQLPYRPASGRSILRHAGTWSGDDFQECLQSVYATRGKAKFDYDLNPFE
ncbi:DUF2281 domain-containing protein [Nostoc sp.]|jgi:hypothetical protein